MPQRDRFRAHGGGHTPVPRLGPHRQRRRPGHAQVEVSPR